MNKIDICNMALALIGRERIDSLDEETQEAKMCKVFYEHERKRLLRMHGWGFARKTTALAPRNVEIPGWEYAYGVPQECVSLIYIFNEATVDRHEFSKPEFKIVTATGNDKVIVCHLEEAYAEYTTDFKNAEAFSEEFIEALVHIMAAKLALPLTSNSDLVRMNMELAQQAVSIAMAEDAQEQERKTQYPRKYERARFR